MRIQNSNNSKKSPWLFKRAQLGHMLKEFRKLHDEKRGEVQSELLLLLEKYKADPAWDDFRNMVDPVHKGSLTKFESPARTDETLILPDIRPLAHAYSVHELMFDALLSESVPGKYLAYNVCRDFRKIDQKGRPQYGTGTEYWIPKTRLCEIDNIAVVYQELKPKEQREAPPSHSTDHNHPGDELIYVVQGSSELWLKNTGLHIKVDEGNFIHFDAEQMHSVWNHSDKTAKMFIVRFLQLHSGTRLEFFREASRPSERFINRIVKEAKESAWSTIKKQKARAGIPEEVYDRYGLGRFLELVCSERFCGKEYGRLTLDKLLERSKTENSCYNRSRLARLHYGESKVKADELPILANIYKIEPVLLCNFLFPAFRYAIVAREDDMRVVPHEMFGIPEGIVYKIPRQRLAHSDVTIAVVELDPGASTVSNRHPGCELLKPFVGEVTVELDNTKHSPIKKGEYAYFDSSIDHRVFNTGGDLAKVLVIRFLE